MIRPVLLFASSNSGKSAEIKHLLKERYDVRDLNDIGYFEEIPETGGTLEENAVIKARCLSKIKRVDCIADDSGLQVEFLDGEPGVHSARYAGEEKDPRKNIELLLKKLEGVSARKASFITVIALVLGTEQYLFEGRVDGHITEIPRGDQGFGYDPVFIPEGHTRTFAEMGPSEKNAISHRAKAVKKLVDFLSSIHA